MWQQGTGHLHPPVFMFLTCLKFWFEIMGRKLCSSFPHKWISFVIAKGRISVRYLFYLFRHRKTILLSNLMAKENKDSFSSCSSMLILSANSNDSTLSIFQRVKALFFKLYKLKCFNNFPSSFLLKCILITCYECAVNLF